jgi:hypothetical protein
VLVYLFAFARETSPRVEKTRSSGAISNICAHILFRLDLISKKKTAKRQTTKQVQPEKRKRDETKIESNRVLIAVFPVFHLRVIVAEDAAGAVLTEPHLDWALSHL